MVQLFLPNEILNDTPADAVPIDDNYTAIQSHVNNQLINRDGSVSMVGQLHLVGDPVSAVDAATKSYVDAILPVGIILPFGGVTAPAGKWAICNGANLPISGHAVLHSVLGTRYGTTPPAGTFNLPDLRGRVPIGHDGTANFLNVGLAGGTFTVPIPEHAHPMPHVHSMNHDHGSVPTGPNLVDHTHAINPPSTATSSNGTHNHGIAMRDSSTAGTTNSAMSASATGASVEKTVTISDDGAHTHTVDIVSFNSGSNSADHTHNVDLPLYSGTTAGTATPNTSNTGVAGATMIPPYVTIVYIIRID